MGTGGWGKNGNLGTHMWVAVVPLELEPKLYKCPAGRVHMESLGLEAMGMLLIFEMSSNFNCWSGLFSLSQQDLQWESRDAQLGCYSNINPPWQGHWEFKIHCHFTQLSAPAQLGRNKKEKWEHVLYVQCICFSGPRNIDKSSDKNEHFTLSIESNEPSS